MLKTAVNWTLSTNILITNSIYELEINSIYHPVPSDVLTRMPYGIRK